MKRSKNLVSRNLCSLKNNMERSGDPLGFKRPYWTDWTKGLSVPKEGKIQLLTARMYQMLPFVIKTTEMAYMARPLLSRKGLGNMMDKGNRFLGERVIRYMARDCDDMRKRGVNALRGIYLALHSAGVNPGYLYESEPYSGILLHDLGLEEACVPHIKKLGDLLKSRGVEELITVDPHTTRMFKEVFPRYIDSFQVKVRHYLEILAEKAEQMVFDKKKKLPQKLVIHDSCVMTRTLGIFEQARLIADKADITLIEPENTGCDTACCGGPVEYAFPEISRDISGRRVAELAPICRDILVMCPICLINLAKHELDESVRIWDMGELLNGFFDPSR